MLQQSFALSLPADQASEQPQQALGLFVDLVGAGAGRAQGAKQDTFASIDWRAEIGLNAQCRGSFGVAPASADVIGVRLAFFQRASAQSVLPGDCEVLRNLHGAGVACVQNA